MSNRVLSYDIVPCDPNIGILHWLWGDFVNHNGRRKVRRRIQSKRKERVGFLDFINTKEIFSDFRNAKEKEPMRLGRFQRTTTPKGLKYAKHSRGWSVSSNMLDNSPILDR